jgi:hypothetical protein
MTAPVLDHGLAPKSVFGKAEVRRVEQLIDDSGVIAILEPLLPAGGRTRQLSLRTLLVGLGLATAANGPLYLNRAHRALLSLAPATRRRLGVTWTTTRGSEAHLTLRQVEVLYGHLADLLDASSFFAPDLDETERAVRRERHALVTQLIVNASLPGDWTQNGHAAVDATFIDANSRPEHTLRRRHIAKAAERAVEEGRAHDLASLLANDSELAKVLGIPDFGENPDEDDYRLKRLRRSTRRAADPDAATIVAKGDLRHAYAAHLAVTIPSEADVAARLAHDADVHAAGVEDRNPRVPAPEPVPHLILGVQVTSATAPAGRTAVELTRRLAEGPDAVAAGVAPDAVPAVTLTPDGDTVVDRGYSEALPSDFHHPMRKLGRRLVFDLHHVRRGVTGRHRGAVIAFGNLYSPGILNYPDLLSTAQPGPYAPWSEWQRFFTDAAMRERFRLHTNGRADADGYVRLGCPALARRATVGCPVRGTETLVISKGLPEVFDPPTAPLPDVCAKSSLTVPPDVVARSMDHEWASRAWYDSFVRRRPRVEGANGILKNPAFSPLAHMHIRVRGHAKVGLFVAFAAAISNLRAADRWRAQVVETRKLNAAMAEARRTRAKRRSHTIDQLLAPTKRRTRRPAAARAP